MLGTVSYAGAAKQRGLAGENWVGFQDHEKDLGLILDGV